MARKILLWCVAAACLNGLALPVRADFEAPPGPPSGESDLFRNRLWDLSVRAFIGYADNLLTAAKGDPFFNVDANAPYGGLTVSGSLRLPVAPGFVVGVAGRFDQTWYFDKKHRPGDDLSNYNVHALNPSVFAEVKFMAASMPARLTLTYDYQWEDGQRQLHAMGFSAHRVSGSLALMPMPDLNVTLSYGHMWSKFDVVFPEPSLNERAGTYDAAKLAVQYFFDGRRRAVGASYEFSVNDSKGRNFDYTGHRFGVNFISSIWGPVYGKVDASYAYRDHRGFAGSMVIMPPGRQWQAIYALSGVLWWVIDWNWMVDLSLAHNHYDANQSVFRGSDTRVAAGVTFRF